MNLSLDIARKAFAVTWGDLPDNVRHAARLCLADGLAVMLAAVEREPAVNAFQAVARSYGPGAATLLAGGKAPASAAAMANGALSHALDFEDTFDAAGLHVNASAIPTVLALAEAEGRSLGEALTALVLGAELACGIGMSLTTDPAARGWYHPPMIAAVGAAMAGARLLHLTPAQTVAALSLVQVQFSLSDALKRSPQSDLRAIRDGFAARAATEAVLLARLGTVGTRDPIGETGGLVDLLTGEPSKTSVFDGYAKDFFLPQLTLKTWPSCRGTHPAIRLALALRDEGVGADDLESVAFSVNPPDDMLFEPRASRVRPDTAIDAKFSVPYCFARALLFGEPDLDAFSGAARSDDATLDLAGKVHLRACSPGGPREVELVFTDGRKTVRPLPNAPRLVASETGFDAMTKKFRQCVGDGPALDALLSLETADPSGPVGLLMARLGPARNS